MITTFLDELCVDMGFCLPPSARARLAAEPPKDVDAFTEAIFVGEGLDPRRVNQTLWRQVRSRVATRFHTLLDPVIAEDIGALLESLAKLAKLRVYATAARYEARSFGNYYVDCEADGWGFRLVRDRGQYFIDAPPEPLEALGLMPVFNSRDDMAAAALTYAATMSNTAP